MERDINEIKSTIESLTNKRKILEDLDTRILDETAEEDVSKEIEIEDADGYVFDIIKTLCKLETFNQQSNVQAQPTTNQTGFSINHNAHEFSEGSNSYLHSTQNQYMPSQGNFSTTSANSSQYHKLPKLNMPTFDGNVLNWQSFWDSFSSAVHENAYLSDVQKFNYLKSQLYGEASQCVAGLQITNTNYWQAIHILMQRFGQEHKIVNAYMQNLLNLPPPTSKLNGLKLFYDTAESYIRGLEALGKPQESYGSMLVPIMLGKLPGRIRQNITSDRGNDKWDLYSLREALRREICIQEAGQEVRTNEGQLDFMSTAVYVTSVKENRTDTCDVKDIRNKPCVFCGNIHAPFFCNKVKNVDDRKRIVKEKKLCYNCLGRRHRVVDCKSENVCKICGKRHHTSICFLL